MQTILRFLNDHILKIKNRKIDFSFVPEHLKLFEPKKIAFFSGKEREERAGGGAEFRQLGLTRTFLNNKNQ